MEPISSYLKVTSFKTVKVNLYVHSLLTINMDALNEIWKFNSDIKQLSVKLENLI